MKTLSVYDPALCCSSGVCGTEVDQALVGSIEKTGNKAR